MKSTTLIIYILIIILTFFILIFIRTKILNKNKIYGLDKDLDFQKQLNQIKENHREEKIQEYKRGYEDGKESSKFTINVFPYKEITKNDSLFFKKDIVLIGYKFRLFQNGIPCMEAHLEIVERISLKEIKEENIKIVIEKIENIVSKIPNVQIMSNIKELGKEIIKLKK